MKRTSFLITIVSLAFYLSAQSVNPSLTCSAGGYNKNSNYQISWSIGEVVTETFSAGQTLLSSGFSQGGYQITSVNGDKIKQELNIRVYPNPTTKFITIDFIDNEFKANVIYDIYVSDVNGKILSSKRLRDVRNKITFKELSPGCYFLDITANKMEIERFKIIKN